MNKETRNRIQSATQEARALLEREYAEQLGGIFDIRLDGSIAAEPGSHLDAEQRVVRTKLVAAVDHQRASGLRPADAVAGYLREAAFTMLNRFVALKMLEARGLVQECVSRGDQSAGFKEFTGLAPGLVQVPDHGYRLYIESLFDEIGREVRVLFDRRDPAGLLWPRRQMLFDVLAVLNASDLAEVWKEDETIGWVYQYYNDPAERKRMREDSSAPQNSRELAVRNQFFTPRPVVEFLADNTLGRIWYEMLKGKTRLRERCRYLVRRPIEVFLDPGQTPPPAFPGDGLSREELLGQPFHVLHRPIKDPRDLRMLDPACGSMHFGLYAFDLLEIIYEEGWEANAGRLRADFPDRAAFLWQVPRLIVEHNLHGIDIDPRATQIASLSLWMRAQKAWHVRGVQGRERPRLGRSNIVCAEAMPGEEVFLQEFLDGQLSATPEHRLLGQLVRRVFDAMKLAGEAGPLLKVEEEIAAAVVEAKQKWLTGPKFEQGSLFANETQPSGQEERAVDVTRITEATFWEKAEERIYAALQAYAEHAEHGGGYQRRLFADDAAHGFAFIDLCRKRYDVVLMNPPFGDATPRTLDLVRGGYPEYAENLYVAFHSRASQFLVEGGFVGLISSRTFITYRDFERFRARLLSSSPLRLLADLGWEVLDGAQVETAAYVTSTWNPSPGQFGPFFRLLAVPPDRKDLDLLRSVRWENLNYTYFTRSSSLQRLPGNPLCYWSSEKFIEKVASAPTLYPSLAFVGLGASPHSFFFRAWWEVAAAELGGRWRRICRGGDFAPFYRSNALVIDWYGNGGSVKEYILERYPYLKGNYGWKIQDENRYGLPGLTWGKRNERFNVQAMPAGHIFTDEGQGIIPTEPRSSAFLLGYMNSSLVAYFLSLTSGLQKHYVYIRPIPVFQLSASAVGTIERATTSIVRIKQEWDTTSETSPMFVLPTRGVLHEWVSVGEEMKRCEETWLGDAVSVAKSRGEINQSVLKEAALSVDDVAEIQHLVDTFPEDAPSIDGVRPLADGTEVNFVAAAVSYWVGCGFGRWDIRFAAGGKAAPELPEAFAPLPACPPGQLQNQQGLPLTEDDVRRLQAAGRWHYDLDIPWDGILVDDPGHSFDIGIRLHQVLQVIWPGNAESARWETIEREACETLGVGSLRNYFRRIGGFFSEHVKRYSKGRRKAPIYWQLATPSSSYSVWLYYQRVTRDTFYKVLNDYVTPKVQHEERKLTGLIQGSGAAPTKSQRKEIEDQRVFVEELRALREEVARITPLFKPDLNDGVIINFAPLWRLVPQHRAWQNECKGCWDELVAGAYDWARLAMHLWPERVVPKCAEERSLAIAHGLEEVFWVEGPDGRWHKRNVDQATMRRLVTERTSPAVKDALKSLVEASAQGSGRGGRRTAVPRREAAARRTERAGATSAPLDGVGTEVLERVREAITMAADGASKSEVLAATGITAPQWNAAISSLLSQGLVTKMGERRGARYHITETEGQS